MIVMHIDANSAFLSWTAAALIEKGYPVDLRTVPAVIAGTQATRHGIVLAKSIPTKAYGIATGESLWEARQKCRNLVVFPPDYDLYLACSNAMHEILSDYSDLIQRYSIDESFLDYTASVSRFGDPVAAAHEIKDRIRHELGFTVNIGISCNKLLAKMGSELKKPDRVHTLYPEEIEEKMWPLPVSELFMVGRATTEKLNALGIRTIGDLARANPLHIKGLLKSHGELIWHYANGIDNAVVVLNTEIVQKGVGNSTTIAYDIYVREEAYQILLGLCERVAMRLRMLKQRTSLLAVSLRTDELYFYRHQRQMASHTDSTMELYRCCCVLFDECWRGQPLRQIGVSASGLSSPGVTQISFFDGPEREQRLDRTIDAIRLRYGDRAVIRGTFANSDVAPFQGGVNDGNFITMGGYGGL